MSRRSLLQTQILLELTTEQPQSATSLARLLGRKRPSISRSLKTLEEDSLVAKDRRGWMLTDGGEGEAEQVRARLTETVSSVQEIIGRTFRIDEFGAIALPQVSLLDNSVLRQLTDGLFNPLAGNWSRYMQEVMAMTSFERSLGADWLKSVGTASVINKFFVDMLTPSLTAVLEVQESYTALFRQFTQPGTFFLDMQKVIASSSILTNEALQNIGAIGLAASNLGAQLDHLLYSGVTDHLRHVGESYREFSAYAISRFQSSPLSAALVQRDVTVPSLTVASYTGSLRNAAESKVGVDSPLISSYGEEGVGRELDELLGKIKPEFTSMRRGSWEALGSTNPERFRHAAVSHRELILQVFRQLIPDAPIEEDQPGSKLKNRVKILMGGSESSAELAAHVSRAVFALYGYMNKITHGDERHEQAVRGALLTGEGLLLFLLSHQSV